MWHMGVDTTTNPTSLTQAQSVIKAQKGGGSPRVPQSVRERKTTGAKEVLPQFQRIHPDRLFPAQMVPDGGSDEFQAALHRCNQSIPGSQPRRDGGGQGTARSVSAHILYARALPLPQQAAVRAGQHVPAVPLQMAALQKDGASYLTARRAAASGSSSLPGLTEERSRTAASSKLGVSNAAPGSRSSS